MNITVNWDNDSHTIVRYTFCAAWAWEDFFVALEQAKALIDTAPGSVGVIMHADETRYMRLPASSLTHMRSILRNAHPKTRIIVIVLDNPYLSMMLNTLTRIAGTNGEKLKLVGTLEEARLIIDTVLRNELL
ncbi:MAG: hypothetical protein K8I30_24765 [Anaerolineae bacterium]|nr:hypothetical protein [Anaerolineae bacterium]